MCSASAAQLSPSDLTPYHLYHQRIWDTRNNMPQVSAISITQDQAGFLWVATEGGLARFDGDRFTTYDGKTSPLFSDPILRKVYVDPQGVLWVGTTNRLITLDHGNIKEITFDDKSLGRIEDITFFNGFIYVGGSDFFRIDPKEGEVIRLETQGRTVEALAVERERLWVAVDDGLSYIDESNFQHKVNLRDFPERTQINHIATYNGHLLLGTTSGLFEVNEEGVVSSYKVDQVAISDPIELLYADRKGNLWIGGKQRLLQVSGTTLIEEVKEIDGKTSPWFVSAFEDKWGNLWFGSRTHGLQRLRFDGSKRLGNNEGLDESYVWSFAKSSKGIFVGTNAGLYLYANDTFTPIVQDERLPNHVVYAILNDKQGRLWLGTRAGLALLDDNYQLIRQFPELNGLQINGIVEADNGDVYIATINGLFRWDGSSLSNLSVAWELDTSNTRYVFFDDHNRLWIGTAHGLVKWEQGGAVEQFLDDATLSTSSISFIDQLADGRMLIGTFQDGLAVQSSTGWYWLPVEALPSAGVMFATERESHLVISNLKGVYQLDKQALTPGGDVKVNILVDDFALESNTDGIRCCNGAGNGKGLVDGDQLYLPTLNGVASLALNQIMRPAHPLVPVVDNLKFKDEIRSDSGSNLPLGARNVQLSYSSAQFYRNSALEFRYRLKGYDHEWITAQSRREAFYTNLPPGEYVFEVQAKLREWNTWSETATFAFAMPAYWYEQHWMRLVFVAAALLLFWGVYHIRTRRLERAKQQLEAMVNARTVALDKANKQLAEANEQLHMASLTDSLTKLNNRRYLDTFIDKILAKAARQQRGVFCIILDIDNFKVLNDELGHAVGDDILVKFSDILKREVRSADHVIRWGGEEFLVVLDASVSVNEFLDRLMCSMELSHWPHQQRLGKTPTCSIGVCYHPINASSQWTWSHTLILADKAMYMVKRCGKAGWLQLQPQHPIPPDLPEKVVKMKPEVLLNGTTFDIEGSAHIVAAVNNLKNNIFPLRDRK